MKAIFVANRTYYKASRLAKELGGEAILIDDIKDKLIHADLLISATGAPHPIFTKEKMEDIFNGGPSKDLVIIDIANPRDITEESDLQILQAELFADVQRLIAAKKGLVFFTRFDNMLAITNGLDAEDHMRIQRSIKNRYPITISMGVGAAETAHDAQRLATEALQREGGAQSSERKEILAIDSLVDPEDSFVQVAHIDINSVAKGTAIVAAEPLALEPEVRLKAMK